jgi:tetratricopeptide (TPR) repeat protein
LEEFQLFQENQSASTHLELAQQQLERAILLDPGYDLAKYNLSLLLLAIGEFERSKDYLRELSALSMDPQLRLRAKYNYGIALFHMSQDWAYEQATKIFRELLSQEEGKQLELLIRSAMSVTYAKMARRLPKERERLINESLVEADKVIAAAESLKRKNGKNIHTFKEALANAVASKGFVCMASENYEQAIQYFKGSVEINPGSISNRLGLGEAYSLNNLKDEALDTFRRTAIQSPLSGYTNYRLGNLYRELGKHDEAINVLKRSPRYAYARLTLAKIYLEGEEFEEALEEFRQAAQLNNHLSEAWVNIAWTILQLERPSLNNEALRAARRSLQLEKNEKQLWHRHTILAFCLYQSNKNEQALAEAKKAVKLGAKQAQAHYCLALAQYGLGQYANARQSVESVMALDKKGNWTPKAVQLLNQLP